MALVFVFYHKFCQLCLHLLVLLLHSCCTTLHLLSGRRGDSDGIGVTGAGYSSCCTDISVVLIINDLLARSELTVFAEVPSIPTLPAYRCQSQAVYLEMTVFKWPWLLLNIQLAVMHILNEPEWTGEEGVIVCFKVWARHSPFMTEENAENSLSWLSSTMVEIQTRHIQIVTTCINLPAWLDITGFICLYVLSSLSVVET